MLIRRCKDVVDEAFYPVDARHGTPYPCRQRDLDVVQYKVAYNGSPPVSQPAATLEAVWQNDARRRAPSRERDAIRRLSNAVHDTARYPWGPDLVIKCFLDLDTVFFGGALRGHTNVCWKGTEFFGNGIEGLTTDCSTPRHARIYLNVESILLNPGSVKSMFSTILHEMCHAFEFVRVRSHDISVDEGHHAHFGTRIHAVNQRSKELLGLEAIEPERGESWLRYQIRGYASKRGGGYSQW